MWRRFGALWSCYLFGWKVAAEKTPPASDLLRRAAGVDKGSASQLQINVGSVSRDQVREIAQVKMPDLNTTDMDQAMKIVEGTARSMGIEVK